MGRSNNGADINLGIRANVYGVEGNTVSNEVINDVVKQANVLIDSINKLGDRINNILIPCAINKDTFVSDINKSLDNAAKSIKPLTVSVDASPISIGVSAANNDTIVEAGVTAGEAIAQGVKEASKELEKTAEVAKKILIDKKSELSPYKRWITAGRDKDTKERLLDAVRLRFEESGTDKDKKAVSDAIKEKNAAFEKYLKAEAEFYKHLEERARYKPRLKEVDPNPAKISPYEDEEFGRGYTEYKKIQLSQQVEDKIPEFERDIAELEKEFERLNTLADLFAGDHPEFYDNIKTYFKKYDNGELEKTDLSEEEQELWDEYMNIFSLQATLKQDIHNKKEAIKRINEAYSEALKYSDMYNAPKEEPVPPPVEKPKKKTTSKKSVKQQDAPPVAANKTEGQLPSGNQAAGVIISDNAMQMFVSSITDAISNLNPNIVISPEALGALEGVKGGQDGNPPSPTEVVISEASMDSLAEKIQNALSDINVTATLPSDAFNGLTTSLAEAVAAIGKTGAGINITPEVKSLFEGINESFDEIKKTPEVTATKISETLQKPFTDISNILKEVKNPKTGSEDKGAGSSPKKKTSKKKDNTSKEDAAPKPKETKPSKPLKRDTYIRERLELQRKINDLSYDREQFNISDDDKLYIDAQLEDLYKDAKALDVKLRKLYNFEKNKESIDKMNAALVEMNSGQEQSLQRLKNENSLYESLLSHVETLRAERMGVISDIESGAQRVTDIDRVENAKKNIYATQVEIRKNSSPYSAAEKYVTGVINQKEAEATRSAYETYTRLLREYYAARIQEIRKGESNTGSSAILEKADSVYAAIGSMGLTDKTLDTSVEKLKEERDLMVGKVELYTKLENAIKEYNAERIKLLGMDVEAEGYSEQQKRVQKLLDSVSNLKRVANDPENALYNKGMEKNAQALERQMDAEYKTAQKRIDLQNNINNWRTKNERAAHAYAEEITQIEGEIANAENDALEKLNDRFGSIKAEAQSRGLNGRNPTAQEIANNITSAEMLMGKLNQLLAGASGKAFTEFDTEIERTKQAIATAISEVWGTDGKFVGGNPEALKEAKRQLKELTAQFEQAGYKGKNAFTNIDKAARGIFNLFGGGAIVSQIKSQFTDAYQSIVMLDSAFANIRMTMSMSNVEMRELGNSSIQLAKDLGVTLDSVMQAATLYANETISIDEIIARSEPTALLASAANMEVSAAADLIQGVVYQFKLDEDADTLMGVVDAIEAISGSNGVEFKRSIEQISEGIQVSGAIAHSAGYSYKEFAAQLGALIERTRRNGSEVANALKMIFARLGQNLEGDATEEEISKAEKAYASFGIALRDGTDDFRDLPDVFEELSVKWQTMTDTEKAYIAEVSAGNRNRSMFMSMMDNYAVTLNMVAAAEGSAGFAIQANADRMDTYEAKLGKLKATFESFYNNLTDTDSLELIVEGFTKIVELADILINSNIGDFTIKPLVFGWLATSLPSILTELKESQSIAGAVIRGLAKPYEILIQKEKELRNAIIETEAAENIADADNKKDTLEIKAKTNEIQKETKARLERAAAIVTEEAAEDAADMDNKSDQLSKVSDGSVLANSNTSALGISKASIIISVVTAAITILVNGISKVIEKQEELRQEYEDALNIVEQSTIEYNDNHQAMKETADELHRLIPIYKNLSKGVNSYGHNISLSAEAYETYKDTVTRIAELSPDLVTGHNNEQVALLNVAKAAGNAADEYARMARNAAQAKLDSSNETAVTTLEGYYGKYKWDKSIGEAITDIPMNNYIELWNVVSSHLIDKTLPHQYVTSFKKAFDEAIEGSYDSLGSIDINSGILTDAEIPKEFVNLLEEFQRSYKVNDTLAMDARIKEMSLYSSDIIAAVKEYNDEIHNVQESVGLALTTEIESMEEYYSLSGSAQQMIASMIHTLKQNDIFLMLAAESGGSNIAREAVSIMNAVQNSDLIALYEQMNTLNRQLNENKIGYQDYLDAMEGISTQANTIAEGAGIDVSVLFDFSVQQGMFDEYTQKIVDEYEVSLLRAFELENPEPISILNPRGPISFSNVPSPNDVEDAIEIGNNWIEERLKYIERAWNKKLEAHINNLPADKLRFSSEMDIDWDWTIEEFDAELEAQMNKAKEKRQLEFNLLDEGNQEHINTYIESLEKVTSLAKGAEMSGADLIQFMMQFPDFDWEKYGITGEEGVGDFGAAAIAMANSALNDLLTVIPDADEASITLFENMAEAALSAADEVNSLTDAIDRASSLKDTMEAVNEDLVKYGKLSGDTLKSIISDIPEMEEVAKKYLTGAIDQETFLYEYKNKQKLAQNELYYQLVGGLDKKFIDYMSDNYGVDLSNCSTYLQAKLGLYEKMIASSELLSKYITEDGVFNFDQLMEDGNGDLASLVGMTALKYKSALEDLFNMLGDGNYEGLFAGLFDIDEADKLNNILAEMVSLYDQIFSGIKNVADIRIEALEAEKEALEEKNEEEQKEIDLIKAKQQLEDARNNKVIREYHEGQGFIWAADQKAIAEAEENLAETEKDAQVDAIDKQIEAINEYIESIDDITEAVERQKNISAAMSYLGITNPEDLLSLSDEQRAALAANYQGLSLANDKQENADKIAQYATLTDEQIAQMFGSNFGITMQNLINSWNGSYFIPDIVQQFVETEKKAIEAAKASAEVNTAETPTQKNVYIESINVTYSGDSFEEFLNDVTRYAYTQ